MDKNTQSKEPRQGKQNHVNVLNKIKQFKEALLKTKKAPSKMIDHIQLIFNIMGGYLNSPNEDIRKHCLHMLYLLMKYTPEDKRRGLLSEFLVESLLSTVKEWSANCPRAHPYHGLIILFNILETSEDETCRKIQAETKVKLVLKTKFLETFKTFSLNSNQFSWTEMQRNVFHFFWQHLLHFAPKYIHSSTTFEGNDELPEIDSVICEKVVRFTVLGVSGELAKNGWDWQKCQNFVLNYLRRVLSSRKYALAFYKMNGASWLMFWLQKNNNRKLAEKLDVEKVEISAVILSIVIQLLDHNLTSDLFATGLVRALVGYLRKYRQYVYRQTFTSKQNFKILITACDIITRLLNDDVVGIDYLRELIKRKADEVIATFSRCPLPTSIAVAHVLQLFEEKKAEIGKLKADHERRVEELCEDLTRLEIPPGEPTAEQIRIIESKSEFLKQVESLRLRRLRVHSSASSIESLSISGSKKRKRTRSFWDKGALAYLKESCRVPESPPESVAENEFEFELRRMKLLRGRNGGTSKRTIKRIHSQEYSGPVSELSDNVSSSQEEESTQNSNHGNQPSDLETNENKENVVPNELKAASQSSNVCSKGDTERDGNRMKSGISEVDREMLMQYLKYSNLGVAATEDLSSVVDRYLDPDNSTTDIDIVRRMVWQECFARIVDIVETTISANSERAQTGAENCRLDV